MCILSMSVEDAFQAGDRSREDGPMESWITYMFGITARARIVCPCRHSVMEKESDKRVKNKRDSSSVISLSDQC